MKNYEKYLEELIASLGVSGIDCKFIHKRVFHEENCNGRSCSECNIKVREWLQEEYTPQIDWSKVPVDTPVFITVFGNKDSRRYFCKYENGEVFTYDSGRTSWTAYDTEVSITNWNVTYVQLARPEDIEKYSI